MARLQRKRFSEPAEVRSFPNGRVDTVELDDVVIGRMTYEPGWRWSNDVKPIAGTDRCMAHHIGVVLQGRLRAEMDDGTEMEVGPGDIFELPPGHDAWVVGDIPWVSVDWEAMRTFGRAIENRGERFLATILLTDIVESTALASRLGEAVWRERVAVHNERGQSVIHRFGGHLVKTTGDGLLARFDGAERAIDAARAVLDAVRTIDLEIRAGIETGEVELLPGDVRGLAVHAAARIMAEAGPGEILVSGTVRDLVAGTDLGFDDRGEHELKGLTTPRRIFALRSGPE